MQISLKLHSQADSAECVTRLSRSAFYSAVQWMPRDAKQRENAAHSQDARAFSSLNMTRL